MTIIATLFMRFLKPEEQLHQTIVIFLFSYLSFEVADALYLSGITSSLFCGIFMGYLIPKVCLCVSVPVGLLDVCW